MNIIIVLLLTCESLFAIEATQLVITNALTGAANEPIRIIVQAQDDFGQIASQYASGITFGRINSAGGSFYTNASDASNSINPLSGEINLVNGQITVYFKDPEANDPDPRVTVIDTDGIAPLLRGTTNNINITAANPDHFQILNLPLTGTAGIPVLIRIEARDAFNNRRTMENNNSSFTTTHLSTGSFYSNLSDATNMVNPVLLKNFTSGTLHVYYVDTDSDPDPRIGIRLAGYNPITNQAVTLSPAPASVIVLTNSSLSVTAGSGIPLSFRAYDAFSNIITASARVKLQSTNPTGNFYPNITCQGGTEITNKVFTNSIMTVYYRDTEADDPDPFISILDDDGTPIASGVTNFPVNIDPGPVSNIMFSAVGTNVPASTNYRFLSVNVTDQFGNAVTDGTKIYWSYVDQSPANQGTAAAFSGASDTSNFTSGGIVTNTFYLSLKRGDDYIIKAGNLKDPAETISDTVRLTVVPGPPGILEVSPLSGTTLPRTNITINITLKDSVSNVIYGQAISFSNSNPYGSFSDRTNYTDGNGNTSSILIMSNYDNQVHNATISVAPAGLSIVCSFTARSGPAALFDLTPNSALAPTGGNQPITAAVLDITGHPVQGTMVYFTTDFGSVTPLSNFTGVNGRAITTLSTATNEDNKVHTITASINSPSTNDTSYITTDSGLPAFLEINPSA
ncbi:MAG: Ig-like domain-containing protein, partial [Spirochaetes bacterium]|nr:Ig-like domain-containing protein [Spirochaetota bacterium]